ncbi:cell division protein FtsZ [candidate division WOR-3 bacterium]|nr:cell division protein FtsZ [candidate division WOR-3 bacterium]
MGMKFLFPDDGTRQCRIKVIGVGGGGGNAVNRMIENDLKGVEFIACNTDMQVLSLNKAPVKIQLGAKLTKGLGAGGDPETGRKSAEESLDAIKNAVKGADMVFLAAGMGGGTGTGATPIIAEIAKEENALVVGVVTKPFKFENKKRMQQALEGIRELKEKISTVIVIPNEKLRSVVPKKIPFKEAFKMVDNVLLLATRSISELITEAADINLDFADVKSVMSVQGNAVMGSGKAKEEDRAIHAADIAINCPLLEDSDIRGAKGILVNVKGGEDMTLYEVEDAVSLVKESAGGNANIIFGAAISGEKQEEIEVTVIATGIEKEITTEGKRIKDYDLEIPAFKRKDPPSETVTKKETSNTYTIGDLEIPTFIRKQMD